MITVLIPAFNEEGAVALTIARIREILEADQSLAGSEILLVDDGSRDNTAAEAEQAGATVVRNPHNLGYGSALKRGIKAAQHEVICIMDADLTYPPEAIPMLYREYCRGFDMVVGARTGEHYRQSALKAPMRRVLQFLVEYTANRKIPDVNSGFRIFDRATAGAFFDHLCNTFSFTTSLTLAYMMNDRFVTYVYIDYFERRGRSKVRMIRDSLRTLQYILEAVMYYNPLKIFMLMSGLLLATAVIGFLAGAVTRLNAPYYLSVGCVLIAILVFCFGLLAVLLKQIMQK